jgi:hypothetical protein
VATSAAATAYDLVNQKIGTSGRVILDAGQSWPLTAPVTLWLAIGALGLIVGLRGVRAARRLDEQRLGHQHGLTDAAVGQVAGGDGLPAGHAVRHADTADTADTAGRVRASTGVSITAAHEPAPR